MKQKSNRFRFVCIYVCIKNIDKYIDIYMNGGARRVFVIVVENGLGDTSSNPERD